MKVSGFFKTPKHRVFEYKPRYYNPELEEIEQKLKEKQAQNFIQSQDESKIHHHIDLKRSIEKKSYSVRLLILVFTFTLLTVALYYGYKLIYLMK